MNIFYSTFDLVLLENIPAHAESLKHKLEQAAGGIKPLPEYK